MWSQPAPSPVQLHFLLCSWRTDAELYLYCSHPWQMCLSELCVPQLSEVFLLMKGFMVPFRHSPCSGDGAEPIHGPRLSTLDMQCLLLELTQGTCPLPALFMGCRWPDSIWTLFTPGCNICGLVSRISLDMESTHRIQEVPKNRPLFAVYHSWIQLVALPAMLPLVCAHFGPGSGNVFLLYVDIF